MKNKFYENLFLILSYAEIFEKRKELTKIYKKVEVKKGISRRGI
jgi:hypothetical protein